MRRGLVRSLWAWCSTFALVWATSGPLGSAGSLASFSGRVFQTDRAAPRAGVVVSLTDESGARVAESLPTRADGSFDVGGPRAGSYTVHVEAPEGVFVAAERVQLAGGANPPMALELRAARLDATDKQGFGSPAASRTTEYIVAGVVALAGLFVIFELSDDDDEEPATAVRN